MNGGATDLGQHVLQTQSLPVPQPAAPELQQRSMSPGGFDSFTLAAEYPSLHMLSPQSQQTPLFSRHQQARESQQHAPLSLQSFEGGLQSQLSGGGQVSQAGMAFYAGLTGLQTGASPGELQSTPEHEQLRSSQVHILTLPAVSCHLQQPPCTVRYAGESFELSPLGK